MKKKMKKFEKVQSQVFLDLLDLDFLFFYYFDLNPHELHLKEKKEILVHHVDHLQRIVVRIVQSLSILID